MNTLDGYRFSTEDAACLLDSMYGINSVTIEELYSYEDQNFHVISKNCEKNPKVFSTQEFVLKILNEENSEDAGIQKDIVHYLIQLQQGGFNTPVPIPAVDGKLIKIKEKEYGKECHQHVVMLFSFIRDKPLQDVKLHEEEFYRIVKSIAKIVAKMNKMLMGEKSNHLSRTTSTWLLENLNEGNVLPRLSIVKNDKTRRLCRQVVEKFTKEVIPHLSKLRFGIINNDINEGNIIIEQTSALKKLDTNTWKVSGLIDFGELADSKCLFEVATLLAHMMRHAKERHFSANKTACLILEGYEEVLKLTKEERDCLYLSKR
ncbi:unnamed protein product [Clavelina lepadiformis]|uniref:Hydroxylysine kinase n=1 Tax=Clavelina lepadiformis TaxID=159417 RepID=A0ABP0FVR6_CLALP